MGYVVHVFCPMKPPNREWPQYFRVAPRTGRRHKASRAARGVLKGPLLGPARVRPRPGLAVINKLTTSAGLPALWERRCGCGWHSVVGEPPARSGMLYGAPPPSSTSLLCMHACAAHTQHMLDEWVVTHRDLARDVLFAGDSLGGVVCIATPSPRPYPSLSLSPVFVVANLPFPCRGPPTASRSSTPAKVSTAPSHRWTAPAHVRPLYWASRRALRANQAVAMEQGPHNVPPYAYSTRRSRPAPQYP